MTNEFTLTLDSPITEEQWDMIILKPCPFCGELPKVARDGNGYSVICCNAGCACLPSTWQYDIEAEAIKAWNKRETDD